MVEMWVGDLPFLLYDRGARSHCPQSGMFANINTPGSEYKLGDANVQLLTRSTSSRPQIVHVMPIPPFIQIELEYVQVFNYENSTCLHNLT